LVKRIFQLKVRDVKPVEVSKDILDISLKEGFTMGMVSHDGLGDVDDDWLLFQ
jgi:hypothetical protein